MGTALHEKHPQMTEVFGDSLTRLHRSGKETLKLRRLCRDAFLGIARELVSREDTEVIDRGKDTEKLTRPVTFRVGDRSLDVRVREYTALHIYDYPILYQDVHTSIEVLIKPTGINYTLFNVTQEYEAHQTGEVPSRVVNTHVTNDRGVRAANHEVFRGLVAIKRVATLLSRI